MTSGKKPLRGLKVQGQLTWDDDDQHEQEVTAAAITNSRGSGTLAFPIPTTVNADYGELKIQAMHGLVARAVERNVKFRLAGYLLLDTDKDIWRRM